MFQRKRLLFVVNVDWFFISHRLPIALEAISRGYEVHLATTYTTFRDRIVSYGIITHILHFDRSSFNILNFKSCYYLFSYVKPHIIHLVTMQPILIGGFLSLLFRRPLYVFAISGFGHIFNSENLFTKLRKFLVLSLYAVSLHIPRAKTIIVQNSRDHELLLSLKITPSTIVKILGSGVDVQSYTPLPLPDFQSLFLYLVFWFKRYR